MLAKKYFACFLTLVLYFVFGDTVIPIEYCKKNSKTQASCRMNYIWNDTINTFVSVLDRSRYVDSSQKDPKSLTLKTVGNQLMPYVSIIDNGTTGYVGEIFNTLKETVGFKVELKEMDYDSCLESIENGSADLMVTAAINKQGLYNAMFLQPYIINWYKLFFKQIGTQPTSMFYFGTLSTETWLIAGASVTLLCLILWATLILLAKVEKRQRNISLASCLIATLSGYLNQGFELRVKNVSYRVQTLTALLFGYIIATAINANLVAKITISYEYFPVKSLEELENQRQYGLCIRNQSFVYNNFSHYVNGEKVLLDKWKNVVNVPKCGNTENRDELKAGLCKDNLVFLENVVLINYIIKSSLIPCQLSELPQNLFRAGNSIVINKSVDQRLQHKLNLAYLRIFETGIRNRISKLMLNRKLKEDNEKTLSPVTMLHMKLIFQLHVFFTFISLLVLFFEILAFKSTDNSKHQNKNKIIVNKI